MESVVAEYAPFSTLNPLAADGRLAKMERSQHTGWRTAVFERSHLHHMPAHTRLVRTELWNAEKCMVNQ